MSSRRHAASVPQREGLSAEQRDQVRAVSGAGLLIRSVTASTASLTAAAAVVPIERAVASELSGGDWVIRFAARGHAVFFAGVFFAAFLADVFWAAVLLAVVVFVGAFFAGAVLAVLSSSRAPAAFFWMEAMPLSAAARVLYISLAAMVRPFVIYSCVLRVHHVYDAWVGTHTRPSWTGPSAAVQYESSCTKSVDNRTRLSMESAL